jgi:aryl-alcohol dehydrogenase-like predicted oxidoreductase
MTFGTPVGEKEAIALTRWAIENGVNFIDTANMYEGYNRTIGSAGGVAETILGKALMDKRQQAVLASKVGMQVGPDAEDGGLSRGHIRREIDRSLARLQCEHLDLYYMHKPDLDTPMAESIQAFDDLIQAGKIRYWGVSNFSAGQLGELLQACDENGWRRPVACQPAYSLLRREVEEDLLPLCHHERIAVVPYQVLQGGLLTGKYRRDDIPPPGSRKEEKPDWVWDLTDELFDQLEGFEAQAQVQSQTLMEHAVQAVLVHPAVVSVIVGVKRIDQLQALIEIVA